MASVFQANVGRAIPESDCNMTAAALRQPRGRALRPIAGYRQNRKPSNTSHPGLGRDGFASRHA